ncbi:lachesin-like isoform X1 [Dermacentor variabilis]|uniref:lachesin-like isoform X1 n=3 Tax=Dermacentor variabilis TaxID=34621 RepID=UPI003F5B145E
MATRRIRFSSVQWGEPRAPILPLLVFCISGAAEMVTRAEIGATPHAEPLFAEPIQNITVPVGRKVTLSCVVDNLNNYRVAWMFVEKFTLLTLAKHVITHNSRFKVTHNDHRTWHLHIHDVQERDRGAYMCQINTSPMKSQVGYLNVVVPPKIDNNLTSDSTEVTEGGDVALRCIANGTPEPDITWRREDAQHIALDASRKVLYVKDTWLNITKVSRRHMSAYLCIASNGVVPSVSKRIILEVSFAPLIWTPNRLVGASIDSDVTLDCNLESHPRLVTYWTRGADRMIHQNVKYSVVTMQHAMYKVRMQLVVHRLKPDDYGEYRCVAKNKLGETTGTVNLYEIPASSAPTSHSKLVPKRVGGNLLDEEGRNSPHSRSSGSSHDWWQNLYSNQTDPWSPLSPAVVNLKATANCGACPSITSSTLPARLLVSALSLLATAVS